jgi:hypothetical protein
VSDTVQPKTLEEFRERYLSNDTIDHQGTVQQVTHVPCMFCGAPDMIVLRALHAAEDLQRGGRCKECGRGIRVLFTQIADALTYEVVQVEGDDPPDYIDQWPRRVA